jgi:hypothetical protein
MEIVDGQFEGEKEGTSLPEDNGDEGKYPSFEHIIRTTYYYLLARYSRETTLTDELYM